MYLASSSNHRRAQVGCFEEKCPSYCERHVGRGIKASLVSTQPSLQPGSQDSEGMKTFAIILLLAAFSGEIHSGYLHSRLGCREGSGMWIEQRLNGTSYRCSDEDEWVSLDFDSRN